MLILDLLSNPLSVLSLLGALVVGLSVHEWAHARSAFALGDPTAYYAGRMTLNPARHIDPLGAIFFLMAGFGWARPVPIDPFRLGPTGTVLVSAAGPGSNVALAALAILPLRLGLLSTHGLLASLLGFFALLNIMLAVFNSLPIPPLDGWRIVSGLAPRHMAYRVREFESFGMVALLALIVLGSMLGVSLLGAIMSPFVRLLVWLIAGSDLAAGLSLRF